MLLGHHLLEHGSRIYSRDIVVLERWHEGNGSRSHHQMVGIDVGHLVGDDILDGHPTAFEQVPHRIVEQDILVVVAGKGLGDVEASHPSEAFLLLEEEELVGLHVELTAYLAVVVDHDVVDAEGVQLLAAGKAGRTGTDDGHLRLVYLYLAFLLVAHFGQLSLMAVDATHFLDTVYLRHADAAHLAVDEHFAGSAFSDAAVEAPVAAVQTVAMHGKAGLMQCSGNGVAPASFYLFSVVNKLYRLALRDV